MRATGGGPGGALSLGLTWQERGETRTLRLLGPDTRQPDAWRFELVDSPERTVYGSVEIRPEAKGGTRVTFHVRAAVADPSPWYHGLVVPYLRHELETLFADSAANLRQHLQRKGRE